jgi:hypothetical protein
MHAMRRAALLLSIAIGVTTVSPASQPASDRGSIDAQVARIDAALAAEWTARGVAVAEPADDATWLRRLSLDLRGLVPQGSEVAAFLADPSPAKRDAKIDGYLADPRFAENFASIWTHLLLGDAGVNEAKLDGYLQPWLESALAQGTSFGAIVREMTETAGEARDPGPMSFQLAYYDTIETLSGVTARAFLGLQIQCAQCHDHPFDTWEREQFNRFTGFFRDMQANLRIPAGQRSPTWNLVDRGPDADLHARLRALLHKSRTTEEAAAAMEGGRMMDGAAGGGAKKKEVEIDESGLAAIRELMERFGKPGETKIVAPADEELVAFSPRLPQVARDLVDRFRLRRELFTTAGFLDGTPYQPVEKRTRRAALAEWLTSESNPWFGRAIVNRAWSHLFGKGLIEPVDDLSASSDRVVPELLDELGGEFLRGGTDLRALLGALVRTRAYGLANATTVDAESRTAQERCFAAHPVRPLAPEQLARSLEQATTGLAVDGHASQRNREQERLFDELVSRATASDGNAERRIGASIPQALFMMNGRYSYRSAAQKKEGRIERFLDAKRPPQERLAELWLGTLARPPSEAEAQAVVASVDARRGTTDEEGVDAFEDLFWALINSTEFQTHH